MHDAQLACLGLADPHTGCSAPGDIAPGRWLPPIQLTPALDRESQISKFSYGQFGIVRATDSQSGSRYLSPFHLLGPVSWPC